jgi:RNA polymerase sigma-70 factor (ECF subfamily)
MNAASDESPSFAAVFEAEEGALLRFCFGITGRREVAEDLVQEAFLKLHSHWAEVESPRAWLFRCVRNLALNHLRKHRREADEEEGRGAVARTAAPDAAVGRMEAAGMLRLLMAELPEKDRELVELKYEEDLKYKEISRRTGLSVGNVGYRLHHVLKGLAEALRRVGIEEAGI